MGEANRLNIMECPEEYYEDAAWKNRWIARCQNDYLGIVDGRAATATEVRSVMEENDFLWEQEVILFAENGPDGISGIGDLLKYPQMRIIGVVLQRKVLQRAGKYNECLQVRTNYEFLCRLSQITNIYSVPCLAENVFEELDWNEGAETDAYILRDCWDRLGEQDRMEVLNAFQNRYKNQAEILQKSIDVMFTDDLKYRKMVENTAPFLLLAPDQTCYGVLGNFSSSLERELIRDGQAVDKTDRISRSQILNHRWKAVIGFQAPVLESEVWELVTSKRLQFWFDNPVFFDFFHKGSKIYYLCQDALYAGYLRKFYQIENARQLPPAGRDMGLSHNMDRKYDVVFIGTYLPPADRQEWTGEQQAYYDYMMTHRSLTFEDGLCDFSGTDAETMGKQKFVDKLHEMEPVCRDVINRNRQDVMETILRSGIPVHVYGDSWRAFPKGLQKYLIIHREISVEESLRILGHTKVALNIMSWHKAGMTERVANILLSGAVCISDETTYLREHFVDCRELVLYSLSDLKQLPDMIKYLLRNEAERRKIATAGYLRALKEHTWKNRIDDIMKIVQEE